MSDWTSGYVTGIGYTHGYYGELSPLRAHLALLAAGIAPPATSAACELGFGQGVSINIHAAASKADWHGTDFNPAQAGYALELAAAAQSGAKLYDDAFADFASRADLPEFDFIGLHGIWSWISDENRAVIVDFVRRKLKVGGVLYISYNTLPGWAAFAPVRHLLTQHADTFGAKGAGVVGRVDGALDFVSRMLAVNPAFGRGNASVAQRFEKARELSRHYLAHEYFNRDWRPMYFSEMAGHLGAAKLNFACSANYLDHVDAINLTPEQQAFLAEVHDPEFRQSLRDFMVNQQFRRDYWVKGERRLSPARRWDLVRRQRVILTVPADSVSYKVNAGVGEASLNEEIYRPIVAALAQHKPKSLGELESELRDRNVSLGQILQSVMILSGMSFVSPVQDDNTAAKSRRTCDNLNARLIDGSRDTSDVSYLASPVTGAGHAVGRFPQLFLAAARSGKKQPQELARFVWEILAGQGQRIVKDGATLATPEENLAELTAQAVTFLDQQFPVLKALQIG